MGDTGSMLLGLLLAYVPIWAINSLPYTSLHSQANRFPEILPLLLPAAVLVIPYTDLLRAVVRRTRAGLSPFVPDNKHLHHRLMEIGHSHRSSVLILYAWAAVFAGTVVGLSILTTPLIVLAATTLAAVGVLALLSMPKLRWWERRRAVHAAAAGAVQTAVAGVALAAGQEIPAAVAVQIRPQAGAPGLAAGQAGLPPDASGQPAGPSGSPGANGVHGHGRVPAFYPAEPGPAIPPSADAAQIPMPAARASGTIIP